MDWKMEIEDLWDVKFCWHPSIPSIVRSMVMTNKIGENRVSWWFRFGYFDGRCGKGHPSIGTYYLLLLRTILPTHYSRIMVAWHLVFVRMSSCVDIIFDSISTHLYGPSILHRPSSMKDLLYEVQLYLELLFRYIFSLFMAWT